MSLLNDPMHPGEVLQELYLDPLKIGTTTLSRRMGVPRTRIERLVAGNTKITPDTALRLARTFGTTPAYWMTMQDTYDIANAARGLDLSGIEPIAPPR